MTVPSSSMSMVVPVSSVIPRITAPPLPMTSRIFSGSIFMVMMRGAHSDMSARGLEMTSFILPRMCRRPSLAWARASCMISLVMPCDLDVHLQRGDAGGGAGDLEVHVAQVILVAEDVGEHAKRLPSLMRPMATPATGAFSGTPASISERLVPHTEAMELEPLDSVISETTRIT